jgi:hypothetical protein
MSKSCKHEWIEIRYANYSVVECRKCYEVMEIDK